MLTYSVRRFFLFLLLGGLPLAAQAAGSEYDNTLFGLLFLMAVAALCLFILPMGLVFLGYHIRDKIADRHDQKHPPAAG